MNKSKFFSVFFIAAAAMIFFAACDSNRWFLSEDKLKSKIQTTWSMVMIPSLDSAGHTIPSETWMFKEGVIHRYTASDTMSGNYSVSTTLTKAFLTITDLNPDAEGFNDEWEIIILDSGLLFIASDRNGSTGLRQKEFTEK